jgi:tetratricopeptide (TPR) repeat protein
MPIPMPCRVLLTAVFSSFLLAQQPAPDVKKLRQEAEAAMEAKDFTAAAAAFKKVTEADPKDGQAWLHLGYSLHAAGKLDEALPAHLKATEFKNVAGIATYNVACVHALKGNADDAFTWLDKAIAAGFRDPAHLAGDTDFDKVRNDPRMAKAIETLKAKAAGAPAVMGFAQTIDRKNTRVAWFGGRRDAMTSPGQIVVDWSPIDWKDEHEAAIASGKLKGQKWRFGGDAWTTLDTSLDVRFGDVTVPAGYYYLTLEQRDADRYVLAAHDAAAVKKQKLDAFMANKLQGGIEIPLQHAAGGETAKNLDVALTIDASKTNGTLTVRFGGHTLSTPWTVELK